MAQAVEEREHALSILERLQKIIDTIDSAIILTEDSVVSMFNPAAKQQWNLSPKDHLLHLYPICLQGFIRSLEIGNEQYDILNLSNGRI